MPIPSDYTERVYAGVLGKLIGVYLGRPFEGWSYERIMEELGEIHYYVNNREDVDLRRNVSLVVTDDDISGTFTFLRALTDYANGRNLTPEQIGQTWLNYIIEQRTILWWGGLGNSTEHTAYLRLKHGTPAPKSGSKALNTKVVAEQIGAQIFVDGWAMIAPGDPELAADFARKAGSVSHDGEAIHGAQVIAAMEAQAFVEPDINKLIDCAVSLIPRDSVIFQMIDDVRGWHADESDWRKTRDKVAASYGYDTYGGNVHMVPNHALIILGLLYGGGDFQRSLMIVNTSGWDTDCNSGNLGCLLGIKNGLADIDSGPDWRGPVADRLYLPTADGGRAITDAVTETYRIANIGRVLAGIEPLVPKDGSRFHFELPGSVQGFQADQSADSAGTTTVENVEGHSIAGRRSLALRFQHLAPGRTARALTPTFIPEEAKEMPGYELLASPTLYPGQTIRARITAESRGQEELTCRIFLRKYGAQNELVTIYGPETSLGTGEDHEFRWRLGDMGGQPIAQVGVEVSSAGAAEGTLYLDYLTWDGEPDVLLGPPAEGGSMWRKAWVKAVDSYDPRWPEPYRLVQNYGTGLLIQGTREWADYELTAPITPHMVASAGIGARVQGMRRYYAFLLCRDGKARLVKVMDGQSVLAERDFPFALDMTYELTLRLTGNRIQASIDTELLCDVEDTDMPLESGAVALICEEGRMTSEAVRINPIVASSVFENAMEIER